MQLWQLNTLIHIKLDCTFGSLHNLLSSPDPFCTVPATTDVCFQAFAMWNMAIVYPWPTAAVLRADQVQWLDQGPGHPNPGVKQHVCFFDKLWCLNCLPYLHHANRIVFLET